MAERRETNPMFSWPGLIALTAVTGSLVWAYSPLRSSRPGDKPEHERAAIGDQGVEARLWQDPFEAIHTNVLEIRKGDQAQSPSENDTLFSVDAMGSQILRQSQRFS